MFTVIPAIDLIDGQVVRLRQGDYDQVTYYDSTPVEFAKKFVDAGITRIHLVDLDGAKSGKTDNLKTITEIRNQVSVEIEVGGGIRDLETAKLYIDHGVNYVILGSAFVSAFDQAVEIANQFPGQVLAGIDSHDNQVAIQGWTSSSDLSVEALVKQLTDLPLGGIIHTDISRDGMMSGPNLAGYKTLLDLTDHPIIASGGIRDKTDIDAVWALEDLGCQGCIVGKAILSGVLSLDGIMKRPAC